MIFNEDYYHPMDRDYDITIPVEPMPAIPPESEIPDEVGYGVKDIGMSVPLGIAANNVQGVQAKLRSGVNAIELQFSGVGRSQGQNQTPGIYGKDQRQALDEIRRINEVDFTTHATYGIMGMTGVDQQGNFSWEHRKMAVDEIKRAIDFASDTAGGGSVVVHTGEFDRPMATQKWARDEDGKVIFRRYLHEADDAQYKVIDDRTGQVMTTVSRDRLVARPVWNRTKDEYDGTDIEGKSVHIKKGDYVDYAGRRINNPYDVAHGRVPEYDSNTGRFRTEYWHFDDFIKEAEGLNREKEQELGRRLTEDEMIFPEEAYLQATLETNEGQSRGWAVYYAQGFERDQKLIEDLEKMREVYGKLDRDMPEEDKWKIMKQEGRQSSVLPPESKAPLELIEKELKEAKHRLEQTHQASSSLEQQAWETAETRKHIKSQYKRMYSAGYRSYAEAGIHAMNNSNNPKNPIVVTMEHIFPERYGGHPEELKNLIYGSRRRMVDMLTNKYREEEVWNTETKQYEKKKIENDYYRPGVSKEKAEKAAEKHIKATIDTAHANIWRKYYVQDPKLSKEQNDKKFDNWLVGQMKDLMKNKLIGNVHLSDNFGYDDEHLSPGQGNAPIKEIVKMLKKHGYDKAITVEPGAAAQTDLGDFYGVMQTWRHFGSPMYSMGASMGGGAPSKSWTDVQYSYFGQTYAPYFVFGSYAPSNDWTLWTGVPME
ncbi:sugar phosphate isomerase/epimerase [Candidatus Woesearchaeota archaeon]|nr:sugar phosphate isomerase/epimerase [Candidatus Woesearchaeota archaeon]